MDGITNGMRETAGVRQIGKVVLRQMNAEGAEDAADAEASVAAVLKRHQQFPYY
jgi:hypothetical protein